MNIKREALDQYIARDLHEQHRQVVLGHGQVAVDGQPPQPHVVAVEDNVAEDDGVVDAASIKIHAWSRYAESEVAVAVADAVCQTTKHGVQE